MLERSRFARYALRFERAFKTDRWDAVAACFHPDAVYAIEGGTAYDGQTRGPAAITKLFKRMLDEIDRRYDKRIPKLAGWPRVSGGMLHVPWRVRYVAPGGEIVLHGESHCRFAGNKIIELRDTMNAEECRAWGALVA